MEKRYQVFISSTFADLEEERKEVMEAIINLDCFPAGMEMFPAADIEQFEYIKTIIDQSDYYVLIIAGRYGSVAEDGKSYTEKEYEYAKEKGIPVLVFVKKDIENLLVGQTDGDPELKKKLLEFRESSMKNRLAKYWDNKLELKYNVHDSLSKAFQINPRRGWIRGDIATDIETLRELDEIRKANFNLEKRNNELIKQLEEKNQIKDIACGDDELDIRYTYQSYYRGSEYNGVVKTTWNELFSSIGPSFVSAQSIPSANRIIGKSIQRIKGNKYYTIDINEDDFNTIKIQLDALNLINYYTAKTVTGGIAEFMQLSKSGKDKLKSLKVKRKEILNS